MIAGWLAALNGSDVEHSAMTPNQREVLLTIVCGFRAFLELPPGVQECDFYTLANRLVDTATELSSLQPVLKRQS